MHGSWYSVSQQLGEMDILSEEESGEAVEAGNHPIHSASFRKLSSSGDSGIAASDTETDNENSDGDDDSGDEVDSVGEEQATGRHILTYTLR